MRTTPFVHAQLPASGKRPVNLTLNAANVAEAKAFTPNLSATVDALLVRFVHEQRAANEDRKRLAAQCAAEWNQVMDAYGSIADEHAPF